MASLVQMPDIGWMMMRLCAGTGSGASLPVSGDRCRDADGRQSDACHDKVRGISVFDVRRQSFGAAAVFMDSGIGKGG